MLDPGKFGGTLSDHSYHGEYRSLDFEDEGYHQDEIHSLSDVYHDDEPLYYEDYTKSNNVLGKFFIFKFKESMISI